MCSGSPLSTTFLAGLPSRPWPAPPRRSRGLDPAAWQRLSAGDGTKGPRLYDWAYCELADLDAAEYVQNQSGLWMRGLLIRRNIANGQSAYFSTWCPAGTGMETLAAVEGHRWAIEHGFETAKTEFGLDHNETRSWHGWHRHVWLVILGLLSLSKGAMMAAIMGSLAGNAQPGASFRPFGLYPQLFNALGDETITP